VSSSYHASRVADALARASWALAAGDYDRARTEARTAEQHAGMAWQEDRDRRYREQRQRQASARAEQAGAR
jgi:hypothetical protein